MGRNHRLVRQHGQGGKRVDAFTAFARFPSVLVLHVSRSWVNYLAPFLLTRRLLPTLRHSAPARIVNVSSAGQAPIDFRDVMLERRYDGVQAYCQSKLALVMFTFDLAEALASTGVTASCLHPATYMLTKMVLAARGSGVSSIEEGVQATTHLITAPELDQVTGGSGTI
ncbi:MAG: SDR family NAD(P)-dependent oxidoreductase [Ktedonobacteraceae bacterium]